MVLNDRQLRVFLSPTRYPVLDFLADPALAMVEGHSTKAGSVGSIAIPAHGNLPVINLQFSFTGDPRDALDRGVDLVITRDLALIDYAAGRPEFATFALPWSRTYLLLQPLGAAPIEGTIASDSVRRSLARDAVRAEARAAEPPFWWDDLASCSRAASGTAPQVSSRIVYRQGDEVARGLAERIVALTHSAPQLRAAALRDSELVTAIRDGSERGYIVPVPRQTLAPCRDSAAWSMSMGIQPLIDTRARAIVRRGSGAFTVDWDGTVRVTDPSARKGLP